MCLVLVRTILYVLFGCDLIVWILALRSCEDEWVECHFVNGLGHLKKKKKKGGGSFLEEFMSWAMGFDFYMVNAQYLLKIRVT